MIKNLIILPDGTEISSGEGQENNIRSVSYIESVNSGNELKLGSACSSMVEITLQTPNGNLDITEGTEIQFCKIDEYGYRSKIGMFTLESPKRPSPNTLRFTAYDRVSWLDDDLTEWVNNLNEFPYDLKTFATMVCNECGLEFITESFPNDGFLVEKFNVKQVTGRQLMSWCGEIAARFVRSTIDGDIEFGFYEHSGIEISPNSEYKYKTLSYTGYEVHSIEGIRIKLTAGENGALFPNIDASKNFYVISGNPLVSSIKKETRDMLANIYDQVGGFSYTPCKVSMLSSIDIRSGQILEIVDRNGKGFMTIVMTKSQRGQIDIVESTGSARFDSSSAIYGDKNSNLKSYADFSAQSAVNNLSQLDIFNKLTNNGQVQGIFLEKDGQIYINAEYISTGILASKDGTTFYLDLENGYLDLQGSGKFLSEDGKSYIMLDGDEFVLRSKTVEENPFLNIFRISYTTDGNGVDYPYMIIGSADGSASDFSGTALVKKFSNGLWVGNSAPKHMMGAFNGTTGAVGFFIDTEKGIPYVVNGTDMRNVYIGDAIAKFA